MAHILRPALVLFALLGALTGIVYPLAVTGVAQAVFPAQAAGSLVLRDGAPIGSTLIGQNFSDPAHASAASVHAGASAARCAGAAMPAV